MTLEPPRALVCLLPGLGDALTAGPVLRALSVAGYRIDAFTMLEPVREYVSDLGIFAEVHHAPLLSNQTTFSSLLELRRKRYDAVFVPAPAPRWQYAATALAIGGRRTYVHRYGGSFSAIAAAGGMTQVALRGGHRIFENVRLIEAAGLRCDDVSYLMPGSWKSPSADPSLLGLHTGSMSYKGNEQKRWPLDRFAEIARRHLARGGRVRAFFGPNEIEDGDRLAALVDGIECVARPLASAARALSECAVVLANDSGLAHVAAGLGNKTLVLFGMTDPKRCKPVGQTVVLRPSQCPPCFDEGLHRFECVRNLNYRCLNDDLPVEYVEAAVEAALQAPALTVSTVDREGPFRLYGRPRISCAS